MLASTHHAVGSAAAFHQMQVALDRALSAEGCHVWECGCRFAGRLARLRVAGRQLSESIQAAFGHLITPVDDTAPPSLRIDLWDQGETQVSYPLDVLFVADEVRRTSSYQEFGLLIGSVDDRFFGCQRPQFITWCDRERQHLIGCVSSVNPLPLYERGKPLHFPLLRWHNDHHYQVIHAGLVAQHEQGILLVGRGTAGKTTVCLSCLTAGFEYLGDDYIALEPREEGPTVGHSLYSSSWLMAAHAERFPQLQPYVIPADRPDEQKSLLPLATVTPHQLRHSVPIRVVILPRWSAGAATRIRPATKGEALLAVAPTSLVLLPDAGDNGLEKLAALIDHLPCYWLDYDHDLAAIPTCLHELLSNVQVT